MNGLSKYYIKKLISCFSNEMTATETSRKLKVNRNTVNKYYRIIREAVADYQELQLQYHKNASDSEAQYLFGWHKNQGLIFDQNEADALFKLSVGNAKTFVEAMDIPGAESETEEGKEGEVKQLTAAEALANALQDASAEELSKLNTIESFLTYAKEKLTKFYGVKEEYAYLYLKELEFRFNNRNKDLAQLIWRILPHHSNIWAKRRSRRRSTSTTA